MNYHPTDLGRLRACNAKLDDPKLQRGYQEYLTIHGQLGQVGGIPVPCLMQLVREQAARGADKAPLAVSAPSPAPKSKSKASS